jgi:hypothetical protein
MVQQGSKLNAVGYWLLNKVQSGSTVVQNGSIIVLLSGLRSPARLRHSGGRMTEVIQSGGGNVRWFTLITLSTRYLNVSPPDSGGVPKSVVNQLIKENDFKKWIWGRWSIQFCHW